MSILAITKRQRDYLPEGSLCEVVSIANCNKDYYGLPVTVLPVRSFGFLHDPDYDVAAMANRIYIHREESLVDIYKYMSSLFTYYDAPYLVSMHENQSLSMTREFYNVKLSDLILDENSLRTLNPSVYDKIKSMGVDIGDLSDKFDGILLNRLLTSEENKKRLLNNKIKYSYLNPHRTENDLHLTCSCCGKHITSWEDYNSVSNKSVCNSCVKNLLKEHKIFKCAFCGNYHEIESKYKHNMTKEEYDFSYAKCSCCGKELVIKSYGKHEAKYFTSPTGNTICEACLTNKNNYKYFIKRYHDTPRLKYYKDSSENTDASNFKGFGVELEIDQGLENSEKISRKIIEIMDEEVYCMRDGSVPKGIEIISMPHEEKSLYCMNWKKLFSMLKRNKYDSESSGLCGLHVHISRELFKDDSAITKMLYFYQKFKRNIILFSRRDESSVSKWSSFYEEKDKSLNDIKAILNAYDKAGWHDSRYKCVNLQNKNTIEIRIMRGTIDFKDFIATLNFIIEVAKMSNTIAEDKIDDYCEWLKNVDDNTIEYMKKRKCFTKIYKRR